MNKKIAITAYDVDPYKGSESTTGWNFPYHIAKLSQFEITVFTRENNQKNIDKYIQEHPELKLSNLHFEYFDLPKKYRFWKKGARGATLYYYLWQFFIVNKINKVNQYDLYHALNFHADSLPSFLWRMQGPFIWGPISHHESINDKFLIKYPKIEKYKDKIKAIVKRCLWKADPFLKICSTKAHIIFSGHSMVVKRLKIDGSKVRILNQVASSELDIKAKSPAGGNSFRFVTIGRTVPLKGFDLAIDAFIAAEKKMLNLKGPINIELLIIGDGKYTEQLKKLSKASQNISFTGWIEHSKVYELLQSSDVFIFPSHEGAGMVVAEAASMGLPIITLDNYGPGELIDSDCGIKVNCEQSRELIVNSLGAAIISMANDQDAYLNYSSAIKKHYNLKMTWDAKATEVIKAYKELLCEES